MGVSSPANPARVVENPGSSTMADTSSADGYQRQQTTTFLAIIQGFFINALSRDVPPPYSAVDGGIEGFILKVNCQA